MRIYYCFFISFLFYGCFSLGCEYEYVGGLRYFKNEKKLQLLIIQIKTYENNHLYSIVPKTVEGAWVLNYYSDIKNTSYHGPTYQRINRIGRRETVHKNEKGKALELGFGVSCGGKKYWQRKVIFMFFG